VRGLEPLGAGVAVRPAGVEHDRLHDPVLDDLLAPQHRVGLAPVGGEDAGGVEPRALVDDEREVGGAARLEAAVDAGGHEPGGGGHAHGATPTVVRPVVSGSPRARFRHCTAAPAVPLARLSTAPTATSRRAASSTVTWTCTELEPRTEPVWGHSPVAS